MHNATMSEFKMLRWHMAGPDLPVVGCKASQLDCFTQMTPDTHCVQNVGNWLLTSYSKMGIKCGMEALLRLLLSSSGRV